MQFIRFRVGLLAFVISPVLCAQQMGSLRAGAAKVDISPPKDMFPLKAGQTFADVHDPLYARVLVLDNGSSKVALISVDTTSMPNSDDVVRAVTTELGIPASHLSMDSTHDHNTPNFGGGGRGGSYDPSRYNAILLKGVVEAAGQANERLQPARIGFGAGKAYINTNRDQKIGDAYHMGYAPDGPTDKTVAVIKVTTPSGDPIAVWSNYAVHGVVMFLSKTHDGEAEITGDIGGATASSPTAGARGPVTMVDADPVTIPLNLVMINDIALANVSGEVFSEIGQDVKRTSLFDHTVMVTLSPGRIGYIPSDNAYLLPSAMVVNNPIKPGCAEKAITGAFLDMEKQYVPIWKAAN